MILTGGLSPGKVAAAGIMIGVVLLLLGFTGWIGRLARAIPQSVSAGLQLGLGLLMAVLGLKLILETPWLGSGSLALLFALTRIPRCPAAPFALGVAIGLGWVTGSVGPQRKPQHRRACPVLCCRAGGRFGAASRLPCYRSFRYADQCRDRDRERRARAVSGAATLASERDLALSSGLAKCCYARSARCRCATGPGGWLLNSASGHDPA